MPPYCRESDRRRASRAMNYGGKCADRWRRNRLGLPSMPVGGHDQARAGRTWC